MTFTSAVWSRLRQAFAELWVFGLKQAWACVFGAALLALILATQWWYPSGGLARYDFLFLAALSLQAPLLATSLETIGEARLIFAFHADRDRHGGVQDLARDPLVDLSRRVAVPDRQCAAVRGVHVIQKKTA